MRINLHLSSQLIGFSFVLALTVSSTAHAEEWGFLGARYQAMGGAGVAVADDSQAVYWNPGALAFAEGYDVQLPFGVSAAAEGGVLEDIDDIADFVDDNDFNDILDRIKDGDDLSADDLREALDLTVEGLALLDVDRQGFLTSLETAVLIRGKRLAVTAIGMGYGGISPVFDFDQLSFSTDAAGAAEQIENIVGNGNDRSDELSPEGLELARNVKKIFQSNTDTGNEKFQAQELVFQAEKAGLDTGDPTVQALVSGIANATSDIGTGDLSVNDSGAFVQGLVTQEVGVAYGHPFFGKVGLGGNIKYMHGITTFNFIRYDDVGSLGDAINEMTNASHTKNSSTWGVDLGLLYKPYSWLRGGIVGRNLNSPKFDIAVPERFRDAHNSAGKKFNLKPQVRGGVAVDIFPIWTVAADADLTENGTQNLRGYHSRLFSFGTEVRVPLWSATLALRGGTYLNTVSDQNNHPVITAGFGLTAWHLALDLAGGISTDQTRVEASGQNQKIPARANLSATLLWKQAF